MTLFSMMALCMTAQMANPVKVQSQLKEVSPTEAELVFNASIESGWHMYSTEVVEFGPTPTSLRRIRLSRSMKRCSNPMYITLNILQHLCRS